MQVVHTIYHKWQATYGQIGIAVQIICLPSKTILDLFSWGLCRSNTIVPRLFSCRYSTACRNAQHSFIMQLPPCERRMRQETCAIDSLFSTCRACTEYPTTAYFSRHNQILLQKMRLVFKFYCKFVQYFVYERRACLALFFCNTKLINAFDL